MKNVLTLLQGIVDLLPRIIAITPVTNITIMRGTCFRVAGLVIVYACIRPTASGFGADSMLFSVPEEYQANAPLNLYQANANPNNLSSTCRVSGGYVRAGKALTSNVEYTIYGMYWGG